MVSGGAAVPVTASALDAAADAAVVSAVAAGAAAPVAGHAVVMSAGGAAVDPGAGGGAAAPSVAPVGGASLVAAIDSGSGAALLAGLGVEALGAAVPVHVAAGGRRAGEKSASSICLRGLPRLLGSGGRGSGLGDAATKTGEASA